MRPSKFYVVMCPPWPLDLPYIGEVVQLGGEDRCTILSFSGKVLGTTDRAWVHEDTIPAAEATWVNKETGIISKFRPTKKFINSHKAQTF